MSLFISSTDNKNKEIQLIEKHIIDSINYKLSEVKRYKEFNELKKTENIPIEVVFFGESTCGKTKVFQNIFEKEAKIVNDKKIINFISSSKYRTITYKNKKLYFIFNDLIKMDSININDECNSANIVIYTYSINDKQSFQAIKDEYLPLTKSKCKEDVISKNYLKIQLIY